MIFGALGLRGCASFALVAASRLLAAAVASQVGEPRARGKRRAQAPARLGLRFCSARAALLRARGISASGVRRTSVALAGGFFAAAPPGKPLIL